MLILAIALGATLSVEQPPAPDTVFAEIGAPVIDGSVFKPHAARVRIYRGDSLVSQWVNELTVGDSAGRQVMRWVTTSEAVPLFPDRPLTVLRQTYDARTLAPLGYHSRSATGSAEARVSIDGLKVRGSRRTPANTDAQPIDMTLERAGYFSGASDIVPVAAGLRTGTVIVAPLWNPSSDKPTYTVFKVLTDTTFDIEGKPVKSRKVEERRRSDGVLTATWYLLTVSPYMVYGEVPLPDGRVQRMTEVEIPMSGRR